MKSYKGYKEMTRCVLEARDEYLRKKQRRKAVFRRCVPAMASFCIAAVIGFGLWRDISEMPEIEPVPPTAETTAEVHTTTAKTEPSAEKTTAQPVTAQRTETALTQVITSESEAAERSEPAESQPMTEAPTEGTAAPIPSGTEPPIGMAYGTPAEEPTTVEDGELSGGPDVPVYLHWDEMTIDQQYFMADFREAQLSYSAAEKEVPESEVGEYIGKAYMSGYDWYEFIYYHCETDAYKIKGDDEAKTIAIKFTDDEKYYLYTMNGPDNEDQPSG